MYQENEKVFVSESILWYYLYYDSTDLEKLMQINEFKAQIKEY